MKKIKVLGINKRDYRTQVIFPKEQKFFRIFKKFLIKLGFEKSEQIQEFGIPFNEKEYEYAYKKEENIKKNIDISHNFRNKYYSIDVVFGKNKIFVIFNYKRDKQQFISECLEEFIKD